jgi:hypothetical protein
VYLQDFKNFLCIDDLYEPPQTLKFLIKRKEKVQPKWRKKPLPIGAPGVEHRSG